jgi:virulence-associated protein VapD
LLFRLNQPLDILRFEYLRTDNLPKFLKSAISREAEIKILSIDFSDRMSAEDADIGQVLLNLRFWNIKKIYLNPIYITQKTDVVTLKKMMKQVNFISDYEGGYKPV